MNRTDLRTTALFPCILHGGDYNPEQWPEDVWDDDIRLMQESHVNVATLPVFGWVSLQPDEETFTFDWLDRVVEKLHAGGIFLCLATATASQPAWLDQRYPDVLVTTQYGRKRRHGSRHTFCPNSLNFRRLATGLAHRLAERYGDHPALVAWHISNEYGTHCYCDGCAAAFRVWLQNRYGTLDEVNRRWYTKFWGHTYTDWSQIESPVSEGERSIQALLIDYDRFQSDSLLACFAAERDVLREHSPDVPITTNLMGPFKALDYHRWAHEMDIVSWDSYPGRGAPPDEMAFNHSLMRGLKDGQPFLLMEQTPSQQNWQPYNALKRPGVMRLWSFQAMAHGADSVMYFQWRRGRGGCEKFHGAVIEHAGASQARVFQEVAALGAELRSLDVHTLGGRVAARAAILFDWENWWALEYSAGPSVDLQYVPQCRSFFTALHRLGIPADVVSPESDLSPYHVIVAPFLYMVKPGVAPRLEAWVQAGGALVTTCFSGIVDETDLVYLGGYPGPLRPLLGLWAEEIDVLSPQESNQVVFDLPFGDLEGSFPCRMLCDRVHLEGAQALAVYGADFYAGEPAITVNACGDGQAYYLGTVLDADILRRFLAQVCAGRQVASPLPDGPPDGVEVMPRISPAGKTLLYVLNHNAQPVSVSLPGGNQVDLLTGQEHRDKTEVPAYGVLILTSK